MAAVTADTLALPRVANAGLGDTERPVLAITTGPTGFEGEGFPVRRTLPETGWPFACATQQNPATLSRCG